MLLNAACILILITPVRSESDQPPQAGYKLEAKGC